MYVSSEKSSCTAATNSKNQPLSWAKTEYNYLVNREKWWTSKNSSTYTAIITTLEETDNNDEQQLRKLIDICNNYLNEHKGFRWTIVGRDRIRKVTEIKGKAQKNLLDLTYIAITTTLEETNNNDEQQLRKLYEELIDICDKYLEDHKRFKLPLVDEDEINRVTKIKGNTQKKSFGFNSS